MRRGLTNLAALALAVPVLAPAAALAPTADPQIAYSQIAAAKGQTTYSLVVMNADGTNGTAIYPGRLRTSWSPLQRATPTGYVRQLVSVPLGGASSLTILTVEVRKGVVQPATAQSFVPLSSSGAPYTIYWADWSPDGQWIAFVGTIIQNGVTAESGIYLTPASGDGTVHAVILSTRPDTEYALGVSWSPSGWVPAQGGDSGAWLAYTWETPQGCQLAMSRALDAAGVPTATAASPDFIVASSGVLMYGPDWSRTGNWVTWEGNSGGILVGPAQPSATLVLLPGTSGRSVGADAAWSPDDSCVIYRLNGGAIVRQPMRNGLAAGAVTTLVPASKSATYWYLAWAPAFITVP